MSTSARPKCPRCGGHAVRFHSTFDSGYRCLLCHHVFDWRDPAEVARNLRLMGLVKDDLEEFLVATATRRTWDSTGLLRVQRMTGAPGLTRESPP